MSSAAAGVASGARARPMYPFTPKHVQALKLHVMSGVTLLPWLRLLATHARDIHWRVYWHRVAFLSFLAVVNTLLAVPDWLLFHRRIAAQQLHAEPVFILGHPRTGTTHLHNLLALDPEFIYANTFQAGFPSSFISLELAGARPLLQPLLSPTRPMDAMKLSWDTPAEDEIAVQALTGGVSFYNPLMFPLCEAAQRHLLTLRGAEPWELAAWQDAFLWFLKKVGGMGAVTPAMLAAKQPTGETGKVTVHVPSPPHQVFRSSAHLVDSYFWYCFLQTPSDRALTDYILDQHDILYEEYVRERAHVPAGQLVEVSFNDLERDPLGVLRTIYATFGWESRFEALVPAFTQYLGSLSDFKKNQFDRLGPEMEAEVRRRWAPAFQQFNYM